MSAIYKFPYDSPVRYLPLVYMLPHDLLIRCPILRKLPRSMGELNASRMGRGHPKRHLFERGHGCRGVAGLSSLRLRRLEGALHGLVPHLALVLLPAPVGQRVERVRGWGVQSLFRLPPDFEIPF